MVVDDKMKFSILGCDVQMISISFTKIEIECDLPCSMQTNKECNWRFQYTKYNVTKNEYLSIHISYFTYQA